MNKINRTTFFSILMVLAYVLSACSGAPVAQSGNGDDQSSQSGQVQEVVFTGTVESMGGGQWTVSGQAITVDGATSVDANIAVGDNVKVEARVASDGSVTAVSIETSGADDTNANSNDDNQNDSNANDNASNSNDNQADNSNSANSNDDNGNGNDNASADDEQEVFGIVEAITTDAITINGVVYMLADFTEFNDLIAMGDQVKIHVIVNADGTFTIREIEKTAGTSIGDDNSNSNGSDDNSNSNGNDDNSNDNGNDNNSNDNGDDDNGNDDNGNDDNGNDDNSNSNGNG